MPAGLIGEIERLAIAQVVTALSCTAVLLLILAGPGHQPLPGTRTAVELLASRSERGPSKLAPIRMASAWRRF